jgi:hypothetical protein
MGSEVLQCLYLEKAGASQRMGYALSLTLGSVDLDLPPPLRAIIAYLTCVK